MADHDSLWKAGTLTYNKRLLTDVNNYRAGALQMTCLRRERNRQTQF